MSVDTESRRPTSAFASRFLAPFPARRRPTRVLRLVRRRTRHLVLAGLLLSAWGARADHYTLPLFVTSTESQAATGVVRILNAAETARASRLRLINPGDATASVTIEGRDDNGTAAGCRVCANRAGGLRCTALLRRRFRSLFELPFGHQAYCT